MPRLLALPRLRPAAHHGTDRDLVRRFAHAADPEAFAELVRRHGPTVLGVCRRAARDPHLADDAFQATFLVLARRAASLRDPAAVGSWLFGVARRTALAARRRELRRADVVPGRVSPSAPLAAPSPQPLAPWDDVLAVLDEELARLPEKLRAPLLSCYHDGRTQDEAARQLGVSLSTLRRRLDRGRELLRVRMTARGATLGAGLFGGVLAPAAAVPDALARAAVDHAAGGRAPARVLALAATGPATGKWLAATVLTAGGLALGFGAARPTDNPPGAAEAPPPRAVEPPEPLPNGAMARMGTHRLRHPGWVGTLQYGLGGKVLVSAGEPVALVWDASSGRRLRTLGTRAREAGANVVGRVGVLADGRALIATGRRYIDDRSMTARSFVWDLERDAEAREFHVGIHKGRGPHGSPGVFAPDGSMMAETDPLGSAIYLFDRDGKPAGRLDDAADPENWGQERAAFSPDGKFLYAAPKEGGVVVWDTATHERVRTLGGEKSNARAVAASADGRHVLVFEGTPAENGGRKYRPQAVRVWDPATAKQVAEFPWDRPDPDAEYLFAGFLPDGSAWASAASHAAVTFRQWDRATGQQARDWTVPLGTAWVSAVAVSPDGSRLALGGGSGLVFVFDGATGRNLTPAGGHTGDVTNLRFTRDGRRLVTAGDDGAVLTWDAATGAELRAARGLGSVWLSPDATTVLDYPHKGHRGAKTTEAIVRDTDGRERWRTDGPGGLWPHPDGKTVWRFKPDGKSATALDRATGRELGNVPVPGYPAGSADGGRLVVLRKETAVTGLDAATGEKRFAWDAKATGLLRFGKVPDGSGHEYVDAIEGAGVSPDGRRIAFILSLGPPIDGAMAAVAVCDLATGKEVWRVTSTIPSYFGRQVTFGPDSSLVAAGGERAYVWDAATGRERAKYEGHLSQVTALTFSADGERLATGGADGTAVVWEVLR